MTVNLSSFFGGLIDTGKVDVSLILTFFSIISLLRNKLDL